MEGVLSLLGLSMLVLLKEGTSRRRVLMQRNRCGFKIVSFSSMLHKRECRGLRYTIGCGMQTKLVDPFLSVDRRYPLKTSISRRAIV
jgi:hypothetical protein